MYKRIIGIFICVIIIMLNVDFPVQAKEETMSLTISQKTKRTVDLEGNILGICDFCIDQDSIYTLSNQNNTIIHYSEGIEKDVLSFDYHGSKVIKFAVEGDYSCVFSSNGDIILYKDWMELSRISIYEFTDSALVLDFYLKDKTLYFTGCSSKFPDFTTFIFTFSDDEIKYKDMIEGRTSEGIEVVSPEIVKSFMLEYCKTQAKSEGFNFEELQGIMDLGVDNNGGHYYYSSEIINKTGQEYYIQRIYHFNKRQQLIHVYNIPIGIFTCDYPFKNINGELFLLHNSEDKTEIIQLTSNSVDFSLKECITPINWSESIKKRQSVSLKRENSLIEGNQSKMQVVTTVSRASCITRATNYLNFTWSCSSANLNSSLANWIKPHYISGAGSWYSMPYCFGKSDTITSFNNGILSGKNIGNINTGVALTSTTVGMDCTGFVCKTWLCSYFNTYGITGPAYSISWSQLKQADAMCYYNANTSTGHIVLYSHTLSNGFYYDYECTTSYNYDRVVGIGRSQASFLSSGYSPYRYYNITD